MVVDLPTPGAPVMPTRRAAPVWAEDVAPAGAPIFGGQGVSIQ